MSTTRKILSHEDFVSAFLGEGGQLEKVANHLGVTKSTVRRRHKLLRDAGVKLPDLEGVRKGLDVKGLNKMIVAYKDEIILGLDAAKEK